MTVEELIEKLQKEVKDKKAKIELIDYSSEETQKITGLKTTNKLFVLCKSELGENLLEINL